MCCIRDFRSNFALCGMRYGYLVEHANNINQSDPVACNVKNYFKMRVDADEEPEKRILLYLLYLKKGTSVYAESFGIF